jgi:hypothetical protein
MDGKFQDILDNLPAKPQRSQLEPYRELINELRRRGRTYREIAGILAEKVEVQVSPSTVHDFIRVRSTKRRRTKAARANLDTVKPIAPHVNAAKEEAPPIDDVQKRIAALKRGSAPAKPSTKPFHRDPSEPLRLREKTRNE